MNPDFNIFYVHDIVVSTRFYTELLNLQPEEGSPTFSMFHLKNNTTLGIKAIHTVEPKSQINGGSTEMGFTVDDAKAVNEIYNDWIKRGIRIIQIPTQMNFGYTFVALDPDGHRLRVFTPTPH